MIFKQGDRFQRKFIVTEEVYNGFIETFKDKNSLHIDSAFAAQFGFKEKVMHGNILNGFLSFFIGESLPVKNVIIHSQEIQYKKPVYLNSRLDFEAQIVAVFESVKAVEFNFAFKNVESQIIAKGKFQIGLL